MDNEPKEQPQIAKAVPVRKIPEELYNIAGEYDIELGRDICHVHPNQAVSSGDEIVPGNFDDPDLERFAFFHELAHCIMFDVAYNAIGVKRTKDSRSLSVLSTEGMAWEFAIILAEKYGYQISKLPEMKGFKFAKACLKSYVTDDNL